MLQKAVGGTLLNKIFALMITALMLMVPAAGWSEDLPRLAVPNISAVGVSESLATTSRNMIEAALIKTGKFLVLSYTDMAEILEAQAFSLSGCTDESCAIEIGELLAADNIVVGDLSSVGDGMVLSVRLVNVTTGQTVGAEVVTIGGLSSMQDDIFGAAYALAGLKYAGGSAVDETGSLYITAPEGMELSVSVDGKNYGKTPSLVENLRFGVHILEASQGNYVYSAEISIKSKDITEVLADVKQLRGNLLLSVSPPDASGFGVKIDGIPAGSGLQKDLTAGTHELSIAGGGWYFNAPVKVEAGKTLRFNAELSKAGSLKIFGPEGIKLKIVSADGRISLAPDPHSPVFVPGGVYNYTIEHEDYNTVNGIVTVAADSNTAINPVYEHNEKWVARQRIQELQLKRNKVLSTRKILLPFAWGFTGLGGAGLALGGGMECTVQLGSLYLQDIYEKYSESDDASEVKSLGDEIFYWQETIPVFREIRNYSLIAGGASVLAGGLLFLMTPNIQRIDDELADLTEQLK